MPGPEDGAPAINQLRRSSNDGSSTINHALNGAGEFSLLISQCDRERLARGDRHERDLRVLQKTGLRETRHRLELELAHDRVERVT
jgi:hypothetical protein